MGNGRPGAPPAEGRLIASKREAIVPHMSRHEAARRSGISEAYLRACESGKYGRPIPRDTFAAIALTLEITPLELQQIQRPDVADALRTIMERQVGRPEVPEPLRALALADLHEDLDGVAAQVAQGLHDIDTDARLTSRQKAELRKALIAGIVRDVAERCGQVRAVVRIATKRDVG